MADKPTYIHDCKGCVYLGKHKWQDQEYDLYACRQGLNWPTVIARYSSDGPDYLSGLEIAKVIENDLPNHPEERGHPLVEAMHKAKERGLLSRKDTRDL